MVTREESAVRLDQYVHERTKRGWTKWSVEGCGGHEQPSPCRDTKMSEPLSGRLQARPPDDKRFRLPPPSGGHYGAVQASAWRPASRLLGTAPDNANRP